MSFLTRWQEGTRWIPSYYYSNLSASGFRARLFSKNHYYIVEIPDNIYLRRGITIMLQCSNDDLNFNLQYLPMYTFYSFIGEVLYSDRISPA